MIDAFYIRDVTKGRAILTYTCSSSAPPIASIPIDTGKARKSVGVIELSPSQLVYYENHDYIQVMIPCSSDTQPLVAQEFAKCFFQAAKGFFDQAVTIGLLEQHRETFMLILHHMLDRGIPDVTDADIVKERVPTETTLRRLFNGSVTDSKTQSQARSTSGTSSMGLGGTGKPLSSFSSNNADSQSHPWRRSDIQHTREELYVDVIETVTLISGVASTIKSDRGNVRASISGVIEITSMLSGSSPRIEIDLTPPLPASTRLNKCINRQIWSQSSNSKLVCVPADGPSTLAAYTRTVADGGPIQAELRRGLGNDGSEFEILISTSIDTKVKNIDSLKVKVVFSQTHKKHVKELRATAGDFDSGTCYWTLGPNVPTGWNATLRAQATAEDGTSLQPLYLDISYKFQGRVPSRTTVRTVQVENKRESTKPFKGVRYQTDTESYITR